MSRLINLNPALTYALLVRLWQAFSGGITLFLIVRMMPPTEQGFYYTFNSVLNLQLFFELGLSFVIIQSTTHYFAFLQWDISGEVTGDSAAIDKWFSFLHKSYRNYLIAAMSFSALLIPAGLFFFSLHSEEATGFTWKSPWILLVLGTSINLSLTPFLAALEGSGKISVIYRFRLKQFVLSNSVAWLVLYSGYGLYMAVVNVWINALGTLFWLIKTHKPFILNVIKLPHNSVNFSWSIEIWPMQWRIAVSWISGYFISQMFIPLLFYYQGAVVSGQMGVCLNLISLLSLFSLTWVSVQSPNLGRLVVHRDWRALDQLFSTVFWQSTAVFIVSACTLSGILFLLKGMVLIDRLLPQLQITLLLLSMLFTHIIGALSLYLRAHQVDPFMPFSVVGALLLATSSWYGAAYYGSMGVCLSLFLINGIYGLPSGIWLWQNCRLRWHQPLKERETNGIEAYN